MEFVYDDEGPSSRKDTRRNPKARDRNFNNVDNWREPNSRAHSKVRRLMPAAGNQYGPRNPLYRRHTSNDREQHSKAKREIRNDRPNQNRYNKQKYLGFMGLQEMARTEVQDIILKINEKRDAFFTLIQNPTDRPDIFVLTMEVLSKVAQSSFDELKLKLLFDICKSNFIKLLMIYMINLPYEDQNKNNLYWNSQNNFWNNYITFCECIVNASPMTALKNCRSLIDATTKSCLEGLRDKHGYNLTEEFSTRLADVRSKLTMFEEMGQEPQTKRLRNNTNHDLPPPDDFRELSIIPTRDDLLVTRPFVRPNIVDGSYQDVDHYLDVQFRLLREDCHGPLREGIQQFINAPERKKYDHIRVFHNVKFIHPYISHMKIGAVIQIDVRANKSVKRINWAHSKRFIFGSLVLFTKDHCKTFITATILDRHPNQLSQGRMAVSIISDVLDDQLYDSKQSYTMIESEVYFEPYFHVLKVLQNPFFPSELAMQNYIVKVEAISEHPKYLNKNPEFILYNDTNKKSLMSKLKILSISDDLLEMDLDSDAMADSDDCETGDVMKTFKVLQSETWPDRHDFNFNESQYEAYKLALTREFAVIQGPPGTGKTYLGIKVAKTLLQNVKSSGGCIILIICYTNHALDQFLDAILKITPSVARIGNQSRNKNMDDINVTRLRKNMIYANDNANKLFLEQRFHLKCFVSKLRKAQMSLEMLTNGVLTYRSIKNEVRGIELLGAYYNNIGITDRDPLRDWLFKFNHNDYWASLEQCLLENEHVTIHEDDDKFKRTEVELDDEDEIIENDQDITNLQTSFFLTDTKIELKNLIERYKNIQTQNRLDLGIHIQYLSSQIRFFNAMREQQTRPLNIRITPATNFSRIRMEDRWALYFKWIEEPVNKVKEEILQWQTLIAPQIEAVEESRMVLDLQVLRDKKAIGMTTSGAARMRKLIQAIAPPIVIVEEAAEVLEQHIVTSLTANCQHLILIGDHQQLRPSASHMKLARHYDIEVSLFERMIKNGIHSRRLRVQHRMRPEIAALISPHIYPDLENHSSVETFPEVLGMEKSLFFLTHQHEEEENLEHSSRSNQKEGDIVLALANYLMQQGYMAEDITILAAYSGQMFYLRKERQKYPYLDNVKITVVDNYQGEESKIILLSLVRNNKENKIGFLGTENRVCVALSRAREGFYIFGNIEILKSNSGLWTKIANTLDQNGSLGTNINLKCQNHPLNITAVNKESDFSQVPEGGCMLKCDFAMRCGHKCPLLCHGYDREHTGQYTKCKRNCERILCELNHVCPLKCGETCQPCKVWIEKTLPCGHNMKIYCHVNPDDPSIRCLTSTNITLPSCGHEGTKLCYQSIKDIKCKVPCDYRIKKCGHVCLRTCHVNDDPDHEKYKCLKECANAKKGCTAGLEGDRGDHQCLKKCYEQCEDCNVIVRKKRSNCKHTIELACHKNPDESRCTMRCAKMLPCEHFCKKLCFEKCGDCKIKVTKEIADCKHKIHIECMKEATRELCKKECERTLTCGHKCKQLCAMKCEPALCKHITTEKLKFPCGHDVAVPCHILKLVNSGELTDEVLLQNCTEPCGSELACKHLCGGTCAKCYQGRIHVPCSQKCNQANICGHECQEPCNQICPPCNMRCEVRCRHSRCKEKCCVTCTPCQEKCSRRCLHNACSRRCGEECNVPPCSEPCPRKLRCGHPCRGVCGEPCLRICHVCSPDDFPKDFLGDPYPDNALFIQLQDCPHILELEDMDTLMLGDAESIKIRTCPFCRKPIINTNRYKNAVNKTFREDINPIKLRVYGNPISIRVKKKELLEKISGYPRTYREIIADNENLKSTFSQLLCVMKNIKNESLLELEMLLIYWNILDIVSSCYMKYLKSKSTELKTEIEKQILFICKAFVIKRTPNTIVFKISQQQQVDAGNEIKRLNALVQLSMIRSHATYKINQYIPEVRIAYDQAKALVFSYSRYEENNSLEALKKLQKAINTSGIVSNQERDLVVKAIGLKAGHWYKCPNGHYYCIADCGGAVVESVCIECKAKVGGTHHKLLSTNRHAGEIDGSSHPAYSEAYNNLGNFLMDIV